MSHQFSKEPPPGPDPVEYVYVPDLARNSLTVFFRWILMIPQAIVFFFIVIWGFILGIGAWFGALFTGRVPDGIAESLERVINYGVRLGAYGSLLTDVYPPFKLMNVEYPISVAFPPRTELNRLAVLFRVVLLVPGWIVIRVASAGTQILNFAHWLVGFITGKSPRPLYEVNLAVERYSARYWSYAVMLTAAYPSGLMGDPGEATEDLLVGDTSRTRVALSETSRIWMWIAIALGLVLSLVNSRNGAYY